MKRKNAQTLGEVIRDFLEENRALREKIYESRVERAWTEVLGDMVMRYTRNIYVKNRILYVSLSSSVLRSELSLSRERLVKSLNEQAGAEVIDDIIIR
ncbi:DciA family protein [Parabacteroides sp. PF5-6]|uniref:DciA family protein n=1 Tax=Parabacteroides sp. PF5-6 TaxID=1742403 RepID=UPI002404CBAF|nr:DciA family protein [Parabacteroides sp. PF5-6]MDF9831676.1 putative nucleic acid-binding Zn ribbon protein [Parabacteroides sp. PF5-6]